MLWLFFLYIPFPQLVCGVKMRNAICCTHFQDEERHRRLMWEENKKKIEAHNADYERGKTSFYMGLNQFSDLTPEEFRTNCCGSSMCRGEMAPDLPEYEDLGKNSYLTPGRAQV